MKAKKFLINSTVQSAMQIISFAIKTIHLNPLVGAEVQLQQSGLNIRNVQQFSIISVVNSS